jgi:hypothetical protein
VAAAEQRGAPAAEGGGGHGCVARRAGRGEKGGVRGMARRKKGLRGRTAQRTERTAQTKLGQPACHPPKLFSFFLFFFLINSRERERERERESGRNETAFVHSHSSGVH